MLLDEPTAALSDLIEAMHESLDDYQDNLQRLHHDAIAEEFNGAMNQRHQLLLQLEREAEAMLNLRPRAADSDREDYHHLWSKIKSLVMGELPIVLQERAEQERLLISLTSRCLSYDYQGNLGIQLEQIKQHLSEQLTQIKQFQQSELAP